MPNPEKLNLSQICAAFAPVLQLSAANLVALGVSRATDVAGGYEAWRAAGLPTTP